MAKFKKNFWSGNGPEPQGYACVDDHSTCRMGYFKSDPLNITMKPLTGYKFNDESISFARAYSLHLAFEKAMGRIPVPKIVFITGIRNGSTFSVRNGKITKA